MEVYAQGETRWAPASFPMDFESLADPLAHVLEAGDLNVDAVAARAAQTLGKRWPWLQGLAQRYVQAFAGKVRPRHGEVVEFLRHDRGLRAARANLRDKLQIATLITDQQLMRPVSAAQSWLVRPIASPGELADWL